MDTTDSVKPNSHGFTDVGILPDMWDSADLMPFMCAHDTHRRPDTNTLTC